MQKNLSLKIKMRTIAMIVAIIFLGATINLTYGQNNSGDVPLPTSTAKPPNGNNQAYPPPMENTSETNLNSAYPPPSVTNTPIVIPTSAPIPKDRIVAISNTGEIIDFNVEASFCPEILKSLMVLNMYYR
ncbi:MAG TPA: hypothetical protein VIO61_01190 [Anaerolineaceae bacterium]